MWELDGTVDTREGSTLKIVGQVYITKHRSGKAPQDFDLKNGFRKGFAVIGRSLATSPQVMLLRRGMGGKANSDLARLTECYLFSVRFFAFVISVISAQRCVMRTRVL